MKNQKLAILFLFTITLLSSPCAKAQTDATNLPNFFEQIETWSTSFNTNLLTFDKTNELDFWAGADYQSGLNVSSSLGLEYSPAQSHFSLESVTRTTIGDGLVSEQAGAGYSKVIYDLKATAFLDAGYDFNANRPYAAIGGRLKKAITANTFAGIGLEWHVESRGSKIPLFGVFAGVTF